MKTNEIQRFALTMSSEEKDIFERIYDHRAIQLDELRSSLESARFFKAVQNLNSAIEKLKSKEFVKVKSSIIKDYNTILVTADGIELGKLIRR